MNTIDTRVHSCLRNIIIGSDSCAVPTDNCAARGVALEEVKRRNIKRRCRHWVYPYVN
jgi:hypothetical protein